LHFERDCELLYTQDLTHGEYFHAIDILKAAKLSREYVFSTQIECFTFSVLLHSASSVGVSRLYIAKMYSKNTNVSLRKSQRCADFSVKMQCAERNWRPS